MKVKSSRTRRSHTTEWTPIHGTEEGSPSGSREWREGVRADPATSPDGQLVRLAGHRLPSGWPLELAGGRPGPARRLADLLCRYHEIAVAPCSSMVAARVATGRRRAGDLPDR